MDKDNKSGLFGGTFILGTAAFSGLAAFGLMLSRTKRKSGKELGKVPAAEMESGTSLALRALGRGTVYAVGGVSLVCATVWFLSGAKNFNEFKIKMNNTLPKVKKSENPSNINTWEDLLEEINKSTVKK